MNTKDIILTILFGLTLLSCTLRKEATDSSIDYICYVDPLIGSGGHGHVFVGASIPHGMVQLGPNNLSKGWDWCSGFHDSDSVIIGFAHTHLSGTGIADLGDILFMPVTHLEDNTEFLPTSRYASLYSKECQEVTPGYYSVLLDKYQVKVELTTTQRTGIHRYTYPKQDTAMVIIDLNEGAQSLIARTGTLEAAFRQINDTVIAGYRFSDEWATDHKIYFTTVFSAPIRNSKTYTEGRGVKAVLEFGKLSEPLLAKTGISYTSEEGAARNLESEAKGGDFDVLRKEAEAAWNKALGTIEFKAEPEVMKTFYTALYHTMIVPSLFSDVDGKYRGADGQIYLSEEFTPYSVFSLWDTYRAVHPLYTLIDSRVSDYVNTLLAINEQQHTLPVWHLVGNETNCMVGVHSIPVIVDACLKGFKGIDKKRAYHAVKSIEEMNDNGLDYVRSQGYIPADKVSWSVARGLEYAVDDYSVAQLARFIGEEDDYEKFAARSACYKHYFDPELKFMRGKLSDGNRRKEFNPSYSIHLEDDYVEGNAWQYTWLVPHDPDGLVGLFGGKKNFVSKLDSLFVVSSELNEGASIDISGMIGQYAHGNEPSHHIPYLYAYVGESWKTAGLVRQIYEQFYKTTPDGLIGNEDCGQMSAWYIFSTLGFYPVNPVDGTFVFGSPLASEAILHLNNGKSFKIIAHNNSKENKFIQSVTLNGQAYPEFFITYRDIMDGGILEYEMGSEPK